MISGSSERIDSVKAIQFGFETVETCSRDGIGDDLVRAEAAREQCHMLYSICLRATFHWIRRTRPNRSQQRGLASNR